MAENDADCRLEPFHVDTSEARPLSLDESRWQLEELVHLRDWLTRLLCDIHQLRADLDSEKQASHRQTMTANQTAVSFLDEMRRLLADAKRNLESRSTPDDSSHPGVRTWLLGRKKDGGGSGASDDWLSAFQRLVTAATDRLADQGVHYIPVTGRDWRELQFEGQPVNRWVAIKKRGKKEAWIITRELQGLWVGDLQGNLLPVQRGEVVL